jgi:hypothetical protein
MIRGLPYKSNGRIGAKIGREKRPRPIDRRA